MPKMMVGDEKKSKMEAMQRKLAQPQSPPSKPEQVQSPKQALDHKKAQQMMEEAKNRAQQGGSVASNFQGDKGFGGPAPSAPRQGSPEQSRQYASAQDIIAQIKAKQQQMRPGMGAGMGSMGGAAPMNR